MGEIKQREVKTDIQMKMTTAVEQGESRRESGYHRSQARVSKRKESFSMPSAAQRPGVQKAKKGGLDN